jgi:ABC-type multidrug transport system fused ATPase/permease subunit
MEPVVARTGEARVNLGRPNPRRVRIRMERNPVRFVWKSAPALHAATLALAFLALPFMWLAIDLVRVAIDDAILGRAFGPQPVAPFLRVALTLPERMSEEPLVLFGGVPLERQAFVIATIAGLVAVALLLSIGALLFGTLRSAAGARAMASLRGMILEGIVGARPSARDDVREAATLAGEELARKGGFLGDAVLTPAVGGLTIAVSLVYAITVDWRLALALAVALVAMALVWPRRLETLDRLADGRLAEGAALRRLLTDLGRRLPAVRAHGTAEFERARLTQDFAQRRDPVRALERDLGGAAALTSLAGALAPVLILTMGAWFGLDGQITPGEVVAATIAALASMLALDRLVHWRRAFEAAHRGFEEIARTLGSLQSRARPAHASPLPGSGVLSAESLSAYDPMSGARIAGVDLSIVMPAHVALLGPSGAGGHVLASLIGGQLDPSVGRLTFGGADLPSAESAERARRIGYEGGDTILMAGSLRENLLYGCQDSGAPDIDQRLAEAVRVAGIDRFVHARGLAGTIDPKREARLAAAIVDARRAVKAAISAEGLVPFVDPFDPARYNHHATVGENILFGIPLGDTFREHNLPSHPFVRAILESEDLTKTLSAMGVAVATNMIEIFADIPDGHALFDRFSFFTAPERSYFQDLLARRNERRRDAESTRDRERLIGLALRYSESRHRLGLLDAEIEARLVKARESFSKLLPVSLKPAIEFYDPDRLCAAASLQDNLLFGRVAHDRAGAEGRVRALIRRVLTDRGLDQDVFRVGLDMRVDMRGTDLAASEIAAIDLARCLVRRPDIVVVERALDALPDGSGRELIRRLRSMLIGRGLVIVTSSLAPETDEPPFDMVVRFEDGAVAHVEDRRSRQQAQLERA